MRIIPFLILNIIVSAATVLVVLNWWSSTRPPAPLPPVIFPTEVAPTAAVQPTALPTPTGGTLTTPDPRPLQIVDVLGAGDAKNEVVVIKYTGEGDLRLAGWKMEDNQGHRYTFPNYALGKGGSVRVFTRAGVDSATELFWGLAEAVWQTGKTVAIYDAQGAVRASFVVP